MQSRTKKTFAMEEVQIEHVVQFIATKSFQPQLQTHIPSDDHSVSSCGAHIAAASRTSIELSGNLFVLTREIIIRAIVHRD